jgi:hypothetical protein
MDFSRKSSRELRFVAPHGMASDPDLERGVVLDQRPVTTLPLKY